MYTDEDESSESSYDEMDTEEEEDDCGHCCDQVYNVSRVKKESGNERGRHAQPATVIAPSPKRPPRKSKKSLSALPEVPLDILLEIFGHLHPRDLVNISRASKAFRETLLAQCTAGTWKRAFKLCGAPACPADLKPLGWATLLFITNCQGCGAKNIQKIDFLLRRRLCRKCRIAKLFQFPKFQTVYRKLDKEMFNLVPYTTSAQVRPGMKPAWVDKEKWKRRYVYGPDVERVAHKLSRCTRSALVKFREKQDAMIRNRLTNLAVYEAWVKSTTEQRRDLKASIIRQRRKDIKKRLGDAGYTGVEVSLRRPSSMGADVRYKYYIQPTPLTDSIWKRIGPILIAEIEEFRAKVAAGKMTRAYWWFYSDLNTSDSNGDSDSDSEE